MNTRSLQICIGAAMLAVAVVLPVQLGRYVERPEAVASSQDVGDSNSVSWVADCDGVTVTFHPDEPAWTDHPDRSIVIFVDGAPHTFAQQVPQHFGSVALLEWGTPFQRRHVSMPSAEECTPSTTTTTTTTSTTTTEPPVTTTQPPVTTTVPTTVPPSSTTTPPTTQPPTVQCPEGMYEIGRLDGDPVCAPSGESG